MWQFLQAGGPFMFFLVATSVVAVAFIIERGFALRWRKVIPPEAEYALDQCQSTQDLPRLRDFCAQNNSAVARLLLTAVDHLHWPRSENVDAIQTKARHEVALLERGLVVLEIVVGIAPLLGLVGTIYGLITLFGDLSRSGLGDNASLAKGISIALNTTLSGLLIAIPSLIAWSYYSRKVETLAIEMETLCDGFLQRFYQYPQNPPNPNPVKFSKARRKSDKRVPSESTA